jgi:hypothetical protein
MKLEVTQTAPRAYKSEIVQSGRYMVQIVGCCSVNIYESVDGERFSRGRRFTSPADGVVFTINLPEGGLFYLELTDAAVEPNITYITTDFTE